MNPWKGAQTDGRVGADSSLSAFTIDDGISCRSSTENNSSYVLHLSGWQAIYGYRKQTFRENDANEQVGVRISTWKPRYALTSTTTWPRIVPPKILRTTSAASASPATVTIDSSFGREIGRKPFVGFDPLRRGRVCGTGGVGTRPQRFNSLVTDIKMPGMNGWRVTAEVRQHCPYIPVIYTTGDSDTEWMTKGVRDSVGLSKPFKLDEAARCVAEALRAPGSQPKFDPLGLSNITSKGAPHHADCL